MHYLLAGDEQTDRRTDRQVCSER